MPTRPINIAIACDHAIFGKALKSFLTSLRNFNVTLTSIDDDDLIRNLKQSSIEILLLSIIDPESTAIATLQKLRDEAPELKIILLSSSTDPGFISSFLELEIYGYISARDEPECMIRAIQSASEDKIYETRLFTEAMYLNKKNSIRRSSLKGGARLSDRDKKIIRLLWEEKSNKQIADELFLSTRSVEKIRQSIKNKLGVKSTIGMLKYLMSHENGN
ncbi:MAG TPA: response regulator transcription factor [Puia sp.]|jgi:DNA-binding NarL/FixJ family response regulator|nr:response regulator transcription factor [Puia sp.]